jgi:hypothetical protein
MSDEGLIIAFFLTGLVLIFVGMPIVSPEKKRDDSDPLAEKQRERLLVYYERVLRNIRDLDEDYALDKIAREEYEDERKVWAARGVQVLKALDTLTDQPMIEPTDAEDAAVDNAIDDAIEAAVRKARLAKQPQTESVVE